MVQYRPTSCALASASSPFCPCCRWQRGQTDKRSTIVLYSHERALGDLRQRRSRRRRLIGLHRFPDLDASCSRGVHRGEWTQVASSLAQGGKNFILRGKESPEIYIVIPYSYVIDKSFIAHVSCLQLFHRAATCKPAPKPPIFRRLWIIYLLIVADKLINVWLLKAPPTTQNASHKSLGGQK